MQIQQIGYFELCCFHSANYRRLDTSILILHLQSAKKGDFCICNQPKKEIGHIELAFLFSHIQEIGYIETLFLFSQLQERLDTWNLADVACHCNKIQEIGCVESAEVESLNRLLDLGSSCFTDMEFDHLGVYGELEAIFNDCFQFQFCAFLPIPFLLGYTFM